MKNFVARFAVLGALLVLVANVSLSEAETVNKYFKAGGDLQLSPVPVSGKIYSIVWKYGKNLLAEWVEGPIDLIYYSKFKGRSDLNTNTGVLTVQNMTADDIAVYTVEINNNVQSRAYQTVEIQEVPQPVVEVQPLACARPQICSLKCHGDITKAGPVSYFWKKDDGGWEQSGDRKDLSDEEMDSVKTFSCRMKNPVSEKDSEPFKNPFYRENKPTESSSAGPIAGGFIGGLLVLAIPIGLCIWKKELIMKNISSFRGNAGTKGEGASSSDDKAVNQPLNENEPTTGVRDENELKDITPGPSDSVKQSV